MLGKLGNMGDMMRQAKEMKSKMEAIQKNLSAQRVEGQSKGGLVNVMADGQGEVLSIKIDPSLIEKKDIAAIENLVMSAVNEASKKAKKLMTAEMSKVAGDMGIPPFLAKLMG
ncbi:MAG: YbaB/EbfC family nucleoid-associated protein [Nitrospinota bacterium]|nr:YbaB/EbfC family nucleoid-associated protein [Nitrospinota bacterium]